MVCYIVKHMVDIVNILVSIFSFCKYAYKLDDFDGNRVLENTIAA